MALAGGWRIYNWRSDISRYTPGTRVKITARMNDFGGGGKLVVKGIEIRLPPDAELGYGQLFETVGKLERIVIKNGNTKLVLSVEEFRVVSGSGWLEDLSGIRVGIGSRLTRWLGGNEGGLAAGIMLGGTSEMSLSARENYRKTGLAHVMAASGYNVAVISGWIGSAGALIFGRRRSILFVIFGIGLYVFLAGMTAAVIRAGIMAVMAYIGLALGRKSDSFWALLLTGWAMVVWRPDYVQDVGFWLSVAATAGVLLFGGGRWWVADFKTTLGAQLMTLPLILHYFGNLSVVSLPVNLAVLWVVPVVMQVLGLALAAGTMIEGWGMAVSWMTWPLLKYMNWMVETVGSWEWASLSVEPVGWVWVAGYYLILAICLKYWRWQR